MHFLSAHFLPELVKSDLLRSGPPPGRARTAIVRRRAQTLADGAAATRPSRRALIGLRPDNTLPGGGPERARRTDEPTVGRVVTRETRTQAFFLWNY